MTGCQGDGNYGYLYQRDMPQMFTNRWHNIVPHCLSDFTGYETNILNHCNLLWFVYDMSPDTGVTQHIDYTYVTHILSCVAENYDQLCLFITGSSFGILRLHWLIILHERYSCPYWVFVSYGLKIQTFEEYDIISLGNFGEWNIRVTRIGHSFHCTRRRTYADSK